MITKKEILEAIELLEQAPSSYKDCEKLATFYVIYDHLYAEPTAKTEKAVEANIEVSGKNEFLRAINGAPASKVWEIMDELMQTVQVLNPRLYDGVMRRLTDI